MHKVGCYIMQFLSKNGMWHVNIWKSMQSLSLIFCSDQSYLAVLKCLLLYINTYPGRRHYAVSIFFKIKRAARSLVRSITELKKSLGDRERRASWEGRDPFEPSTRQLHCWNPRKLPVEDGVQVFDGRDISTSLLWVALTKLGGEFRRKTKSFSLALH